MTGKRTEWLFLLLCFCFWAAARQLYFSRPLDSLVWFSVGGWFCMAWELVLLLKALEISYSRLAEKWNDQVNFMKALEMHCYRTDQECVELLRSITGNSNSIADLRDDLENVKDDVSGFAKDLKANDSNNNNRRVDEDEDETAEAV